MSDSFYRAKVLAAALGFSLVPSFALAVDQWTFSLNVGDDQRIAYTTCDDPEIWHECVVLDIGCTSTEGKLSIIDGGAIVARIVSDGQQAPTLAFTINNTTVSIPVYGFSVGYSDLDGFWTVQFASTEMADAFKVIQSFPEADVSLALGEERFILTPRDEARLALVEISKRCSTIE